VRSHESNKKQKFVSQKNAIDCEEEEDVKSWKIYGEEGIKRTGGVEH
jgi:hypothetical protein